MSGREANGVSLPREPRSAAGPLIQPTSEQCAECWACIRVCPARALRVVDGHAEVVEDRCVKCGACVVSCANAAHTVRDDTQAVRALLRSGRPVVALLATEASAALYPSSIDDVESALEAVGFHAVETTVLGEELVASAYERVLARPDTVMPRLRSTCPVTVDWVCRYYPQLAGALVPVVPPYVAQARLIRRVYPADVAVVYVSPCFARKDEVFAPEVGDAVDVAIDFGELKRLISAAPVRPRSDTRASRIPRPSKQISLTDGFPKRILTDACNGAPPAVATVRGVREVDELLSAILRGETAPPIVDMMLCDGCIDGPAVARHMSVYAKRGIATAERERGGPALVETRSLLAALPEVELQRSFVARPALREVPSATQIDDELVAAGFVNEADVLDCGACGHATCAEQAEAVISGMSSWEMCVPMQRRRLHDLEARLDSLAARDALTGLYNRRHFDERLAEEVARARRSGDALSLVMFDLDAFKSVNDRLGHPAGDAALLAVAGLLRRELRASDVPCRFGGDEFALILPDTAKTEAFAVAEKLRGALRDHRVEAEGAQPFGVTASLGVATLGVVADSATGLLAAADKALYQAKSAGRDRTALAAG